MTLKLLLINRSSITGYNGHIINKNKCNRTGLRRVGSWDSCCVNDDLIRLHYDFK